jgi:hypothetical protein
MDGEKAIADSVEPQLVAICRAPASQSIVKDLDFFQRCHDGINLAAWVLFILNVSFRYRQGIARVLMRLAN